MDYAKAFDCVDHNKLWKILQEMGTPDQLTCLLRNLYAEYIKGSIYLVINHSWMLTKLAFTLSTEKVTSLDSLVPAGCMSATRQVTTLRN